jgi:hypothetical protein
LNLPYAATQSIKENTQLPLVVCQEIGFIYKYHADFFWIHFFHVRLKIFTAKQQRVTSINYLHHYITARKQT